MNLEKAKIILEKINVLMKSIESSPESVAAIERDLMRSYVQQFYEIFVSGQKALPEEKPVKVSQPQEPLAPAIELEVKKPAGKTPPPPPEPEEDTPPPFEDVQERVKSKKEPSAAPTIEELPQPLKQITWEDEEEEEPLPTPAPRPNNPEKPAQKSNVSSELEELFEISGAVDLSEKLGQLPIPDLSKALGLNEKIFTINELFGSDQNLFNQVIVQLNSFSSFTEAKDFLCEEVAAKFSWTSKEKKKKAKEFIKIVWRRYS